MKNFIKEFKEFALKGNVMDLAIGVVIGGAFTAIVTSLVQDIMTPLIGLVANTGNLEKFEIVLKPEIIDSAGEVIQAGAILRVGAFLNALIGFLIIAFVIFTMIRALNKLKRNKEEVEVEEEVVVPSDEVLLLEKIYQELKKD